MKKLINKNKIKLIIFLFFLATTSGYVIWQQNELISQQVNTVSDREIEDRSLMKIKIGIKEYYAEIVNTPESRSLGLSGRSSIGQDKENVNAMLFIFPKKQRHVFWMKDMSFDLDMIWIANNKVVDITKDAPSPKKHIPLSQLPKYSPDKPADMVLEVYSGESETISIGDEVLLNEE